MHEILDSLSFITALASGLKNNTTIEQLAINWFPGEVNKDQFQMLTDAVDSSTAKKLWLGDYIDYKQWFRECTLSKNNVDIEWCNDHSGLYNEW